jgi:hypothetical protein
VVSDHSEARLPDEDLWAAGLNISEIVAQKHLLARITALEIAVAQLEKGLKAQALEAVPLDLVQVYTEMQSEKRKPGRPRKNA